MSVVEMMSCEEERALLDDKMNVEKNAASQDVTFKVTMNGVSNGFYYRNAPNGLGTKPGHLLLKLLVPSNVAGIIIGKSGAQIKELQTTYEVSIKLSQNNHFYPESNKFISNERIVLITGPPERLVQVSEFVHSVVRNPPQSRDMDHLMDGGRRQQQMKLVVSNTTAGMIIGKGGETIKSLNDKYEVRIQLSQKDEIVLGERIVTIQGSEDGINHVIEFIIKDKFRDDPTSASIANLDYSTYMEQPGSYNQMPMGGHTMGSSNSLNYAGFESAGTQDLNNVGLLQSLLNQSAGGNAPQPPAQHNAQQHYGGYPIQHNTNSFGSMSSQQPPQPPKQASPGGDNANEVLAKVLSQALNSNTLATALVQALAGNAAAKPVPRPNQFQQQMIHHAPARMQLRPFIPRPDDVKYRVAVPDSLVGRILGRQGCTITEIQNTTGCEIKFSQRGEYMPGTQNRILYISGQITSCASAQQLVLQKIEAFTLYFPLIQKNQTQTITG